MAALSLLLPGGSTHLTQPRAAEPGAISWPLDNRLGTAPSTPAITVTAKQQMPGGFTLSFYGSTDKLVYSGDIPAGSVVELVPGEHAVLIDGKLSPIVAVGRWPSVPPGELVQLSLTANNTTDFEATATWSPAWW